MMPSDDRQHMMTPPEKLEELERAEHNLVFDSFDNDDAWRLGNLMVALCRERKLAVALNIRRGGQVLFHYGHQGSSPDNDTWIARKSRLTERFQTSSYLVRKRLEAGDSFLQKTIWLDPDDFALAGGSVPVRVAGIGVVGAVTVSGLSDEEDHELACEAIRLFLASPVHKR